MGQNMGTRSQTDPTNTVPIDSNYMRRTRMRMKLLYIIILHTAAADHELILNPHVQPNEVVRKSCLVHTCDPTRGTHPNLVKNCLLSSSNIPFRRT